MTFQYEDGEEGSAFLVTDVGTVMPEVRAMAREIVIIVVLILRFYNRSTDRVDIQSSHGTGGKDPEGCGEY